MSAVTEKYGWVGDHGERTPEPSFEPDMAALIDGEADADTSNDLAACAEVMRGVFALVFAQREGTNAPVKLDLAFRRFICLTWLMRPELLGHVSLAELAPQLCVTRAALSKMVRNYGDSLGIRNALMKRESARAIYAEAQRKDHWRNRAKRKPPASEETGGCHDEHSETPTPEPPHV
ncbi:MAG: hypothetical protein WCF18_15315 [Chthoniobacteraceae bacterium]